MTATIAPSSDLHQLAAEIKNEARSLGFDLVGIADAAPTERAEAWKQWLDEARYGTMQYMARRVDERTDPSRYMPGCQSVICVAVNYSVPLLPAPPGQGNIARYALGDDYHEQMKSRLYRLADWVRQRAPDAQTRCAVDTAPVPERELAARAGIGWVGKNTCVINAEAGSWLLLGELLTTLPLPTDQPATDRCGTCRRCIDACPTQALEPYKLDARRCISYLNIESGSPVPTEFHAAIGSWLYGCDICQEVCPWNHEAPLPTQPWLSPRFVTGSIDLNVVIDRPDDELKRMLRHSAMKRVKLPILRENAKIVRANFQQGHSG